MATKVRRFKLEDIEQASDNYQGFCTACGALRDMCEPDARNYECGDCGKRAVFGAEELVLMGLVD